MSSTGSPDDEAWDGGTYGERAEIFLTSKQLTAGQMRALEPRVDEYVALNRGMRKAFAEQVG